MINKDYPQAKDIEKNVLGIFLLETGKFALYADKLNSDCFYDGRNKTVFDTMFSLFSAGEKMDMTIVAQKINKESRENYILYLMQLTNYVSSSANLDDWIKILIEKSMARQIIRIADWARITAINETSDIFDVQSELLNRVDNLTKQIKQGEISFKECANEALSEMKKANENSGIVGLKTGFYFIDQNMLGLAAPDVTVIAARPSQGKTTLAFNIAINLAKNDIPIGFFSFEMKAIQLAQKTFSNFIPESVNKIRQGNLNNDQWEKLGDDFKTIENLPLHIEDSGTLTIPRMKSIVKTWQVKYGIEAVFIDYLQLITSSIHGNREAQVSQLARDIKLMAMDCNLPIVLLSQLSRENASGEPELHYLRSSGEIEQSADNVLFLHPNMEETHRLFPNWVEGDPEWVTDWLLKKCRLGTKGKRSMVFNAAHNSFNEISTFSEQQNYF